MKIIKNRTVTTDQWRYHLDAVEGVETAASAQGDVIVSVQRWLGGHRSLIARRSRTGVLLRAGDDLEVLVGCELHQLSLIAIEFPSFAEGRGYSQARLLRSRHEFAGAIRAVGDVSRDRIAFMARCGFDELEFSGQCDAAQALQAFTEIAQVYQPAADGLPTVATSRGYRFRPPAEPVTRREAPIG